MSTSLSFWAADKDDIACIENSTKGQYKNPQWYAERTGRITASIAHSVAHHRKTTPPDVLVKKIMGYGRILGDLKESDPRVHGARTEAAARAAYEERMQDHIYVEECGLFILEEHPWLGASPDWLLTCLDTWCTVGIETTWR